jgi:hypothetical protein
LIKVIQEPKKHSWYNDDILQEGGIRDSLLKGPITSVNFTLEGLRRLGTPPPPPPPNLPNQNNEQDDDPLPPPPPPENQGPLPPLPESPLGSDFYRAPPPPVTTNINQPRPNFWRPPPQQLHNRTNEFPPPPPPPHPVPQTTSATKLVGKVARIYTKDMKYNGSNGNFGHRRTIFEDVCRHVDLPDKEIMRAFPTMLKELALDYYYSNQLRMYPYPKTYVKIMAFFEGPEYQRYNLSK